MSLPAPDTLPALEEHELVNTLGDRVSLLNFGARVTGIRLALPGGTRAVTLEYPQLEDWVRDRYFIGATIGRYCNRICDARFTLDGEVHVLAANEGPHQLHGGPDGYHRRFWRAGGGADRTHIEYCLYSPDGDQGFPGELHACVRYSWNDERELAITFSATTDRPTHVNLCNHSYFNLDGGGDVLQHTIFIDADEITTPDPDRVVTGSRFDVSGSPLDLRHATRIRDIRQGDHPFIARAGGGDFNYVLNDDSPAAILGSSSGDLVLTVTTTCPGLQFYTGQHLGTPFAPSSGVCLEAQYFPDSPNQPRFPSTRLDPGQLYTESTVYRFTAT